MVPPEKLRKRKCSWASGSSDSNSVGEPQTKVTGEGQTQVVTTATKTKSAGRQRSSNIGTPKKKSWELPRPPRTGIALALRSNPDAELVPGLPYYTSWSPRKSNKAPSPAKVARRRSRSKSDETQGSDTPNHRNVNYNNNNTEDNKVSAKTTRAKLEKHRPSEAHSKSATSVSSSASGEAVGSAKSSSDIEGPGGKRIRTNSGQPRNSKSVPIVLTKTEPSSESSTSTGKSTGNYCVTVLWSVHDFNKFEHVRGNVRAMYRDPLVDRLT